MYDSMYLMFNLVLNINITNCRIIVIKFMIEKMNINLFYLTTHMFFFPKKGVAFPLVRRVFTERLYNVIAQLTTNVLIMPSTSSRI